MRGLGPFPHQFAYLFVWRPLYPLISNLYADVQVYLCPFVCQHVPGYLLASDYQEASVLMNKVSCIRLHLFKNVFTLPASCDPPPFLASKYESHRRKESRLPPRTPGYCREWEMVILGPAGLEVQERDDRIGMPCRHLEDSVAEDFQLLSGESINNSKP